MKKTRWTKEEFIEEVDPCGYRFRIWWFFLWHRYVTLLDVANAKLSLTNKHSVIWDLAGAHFAARCLGRGQSNFGASIRAELEAS